MDIWEFIETIAKNSAKEAIIALAGIAFTATVGWFATYRRARQRIKQAEQRVTRVKDGNHEREGRGIWLSKPIQHPAHYKMRLRGSKPIMVVGNLKGGVGKTTVASNLAAHYAIKKGERVLVIDADYQGSISSMMFTKSLSLKLASKINASQCSALLIVG